MISCRYKKRGNYPNRFDDNIDRDHDDLGGGSSTGSFNLGGLFGNTGGATGSKVIFITYTTIRRDTWKGIAAKFKISVADLQQANPDMSTRRDPPETVRLSVPHVTGMYPPTDLPDSVPVSVFSSDDYTSIAKRTFPNLNLDQAVDLMMQMVPDLEKVRGYQFNVKVSRPGEQ